MTDPSHEYTRHLMVCHVCYQAIWTRNRCEAGEALYQAMRQYLFSNPVVKIHQPTSKPLNKTWRPQREDEFHPEHGPEFD